MPISGAHDSSAAHRLLGEDPPSTLIIAAHPDDEVIGAAAVLMRLGERAAVLHITDGAPRDLKDAKAAGFGTAEAYASARRAESRAALAFANGATLLDSLNVPDQRAAHCLADVTTALVEILLELRPELILTHAFEGGHPDHDAASFAAAFAARACRIPVVEMSGYFDDGSGMCTNCFAQPDPVALAHRLNRNEQLNKRRMFDCFQTQTQTLAAFGTEVEWYRDAPIYDFTESPNGGRALYDRFDWGLRSTDWPALAARTRQRLGCTGRIVTTGTGAAGP